MQTFWGFFLAGVLNNFLIIHISVLKIFQIMLIYCIPSTVVYSCTNIVAINGIKCANVSFAEIGNSFKQWNKIKCEKCFKYVENFSHTPISIPIKRKTLKKTKDMKITLHSTILRLFCIFQCLKLFQVSLLHYDLFTIVSSLPDIRSISVSKCANWKSGNFLNA